MFFIEKLKKTQNRFLQQMVHCIYHKYFPVRLGVSPHIRCAFGVGVFIWLAV